MESNHLEQQIQSNQLQTWERLMYVALGVAIAIVFHGTDPLRDVIMMLALLYTTLAGFYLLWASFSQNLPLTGLRRKVVFGHLFASWVTSLGIYSYSMLPPLGLVFVAYTVFLLVIYWRTRKKLATSDEMFP